MLNNIRGICKTNNSSTEFAKSGFNRNRIRLSKNISPIQFTHIILLVTYLITLNFYYSFAENPRIRYHIKHLKEILHTIPYCIIRLRIYFNKTLFLNCFKIGQEIIFYKYFNLSVYIIFLYINYNKPNLQTYRL